MSPVTPDLKSTQAFFKQMMRMPHFGVESNIGSLEVAELDYDAEDEGDRRRVRSARIVLTGVAQQGEGRSWKTLIT